MTRTQRFRLRVRLDLADLRDWFLRWIYAQHNARVIVDFERRMACAVELATGGMMSKPYYTADAIEAEILAAQSRAYDIAYADGRNDLADELGVEDPSPVVPE